MNQSKHLGTILGLALGDALGFPVEGFSSSKCVQYTTALLNTGKVRQREGFLPGQFSDDTQLSLELLSSLIENKGLNINNYASRIASLFKNHTIVGRGMATQSAAENILKNIPLEECATPAPMAGNGTTMRSAPIGLYFDGKFDQIIEKAIEQSKITHADDRASAGSVVIAISVAYLSKFSHVKQNEVSVNELNKFEFLEFVSNSIQDVSSLFSQSILQLRETLDLEPLGAARLISTWGEPDFLDGWKYISPYVIPSVCWSIWCFLKHPNSYKGAVLAAINGGGDVDTTASMTGALSGAFLGSEALPVNWVKLIHDRNRWSYEKVVSLINSL